MSHQTVQVAPNGDQYATEDATEDDTESITDEEIIYDNGDEENDDEYARAKYEYIEQQPLPPTIILSNVEMYHIPYKVLSRHDNITYPYNRNLYDKKVMLVILTGYKPDCKKLEKFKVPLRYQVPDNMKLYYNYNIPNITINTNESHWFEKVMRTVPQCNMF
jgi:hypothetical protein